MQEVEIQPYYLSSVNPSTRLEISTISKLSELIKKRSETKCNLLPLIVVDANQIRPNEVITKAWERLHEKTQLGSQ